MRGCNLPSAAQGLAAVLAYDEEGERDDAARAVTGAVFVRDEHDPTVDECVKDPAAGARVSGGRRSVSPGTGS